MSLETLLMLIATALWLIYLCGLWWWIELGSAKRDMMRAYAESIREVSFRRRAKQRGGRARV